jgi:hypothetical protein
LFEPYWNRVLQITLQPNPAVGGDPLVLSTASGRLEELHAAFRVEKTLGKSTNTAEVTLANLADDAVAVLRQAGTILALDAGYEAGGAKRIFTGDVTRVHDARPESDRATVLRCHDGAVEKMNRRVALGFAPGTTLAEMIDAVFRKFGDGKRQEIGDMKAAAARQLSGATAAAPHGRSLCGSASKVLTTLIAPLRGEWSFQDGAAQIVGEEKALDLPPVEISPATGMIGRPEEVESDDDRAAYPRVRVSCLLCGDLFPGVPLTIESPVTQAVATWKAVRVTHVGDTHGNEWTTTVEAIALP